MCVCVCVCVCVRACVRARARACVRAYNCSQSLGKGLFQPIDRRLAVMFDRKERLPTFMACFIFIRSATSLKSVSLHTTRSGRLKTNCLLTLRDLIISNDTFNVFFFFFFYESRFATATKKQQQC